MSDDYSERVAKCCEASSHFAKPPKLGGVPVPPVGALFLEIRIACYLGCSERVVGRAIGGEGAIEGASGRQRGLNRSPATDGPKEREMLHASDPPVHFKQGFPPQTCLLSVGEYD